MKRIRRKKKRNLIMIFIVLAILLFGMAVGHAAFVDSLHINGLANVDPSGLFSTYTVIFDPNGGTGTMESQEIQVGELTSLNSNMFNWSGHGFVKWNTSPTGIGDTYFDEQLVRDIAAGGEEITLYAQWVEGVARIGNVYYRTLQAAINAVPTNNTETTVELLADVNESLTVAKNKNINFDLNHYTVSTSNKWVLQNNGTVKISNGNLVSNSTTDGLLNNESGATLVISGGRLINNAEGGKQAIYNNGGNVTITGSAYLSNASKPGVARNVRGCVQNASGTLTITGGTIVSNNYDAVVNAGTMTIGVQDGNPDKKTPIMQGATSGITSTANFAFYNGIAKGKTHAISDVNKITALETGYDIVQNVETIGGELYKTAYLGHAYTVTFDPNGGTTPEATRTIDMGEPLGPLPELNRVGYEFDGWFTQAEGGEQISADLIVTGNVTFYAHWTKVVIATIDGQPYYSFKEAVEAIPTDNVQKTIVLVHDTSESAIVIHNQNIKLVFDGHTLSNSTSDAVIENNGTVEFVSGSITSNGETSAINNNRGGVFKMSGGIIKAYGTRQAIYNLSGGYVEISGSAYLSSSCSGFPPATQSSLQRGTVQNLRGANILITGGTIVGSVQNGISNEGTMTIGVKDGNVSTSSPKITGTINGIETTGTLNFYDGIARGQTSAINGTVTDIEADTQMLDGTITLEGATYHTNYLE